jgi:hypothetical protein
VKATIVVLLVALALSSPPGRSLGTEYVLGEEGYYWSEGVPYTRTWVEGTPGYYALTCSYGCRSYVWVPGTAGYYRYTRVALTPQTPDWQSKMLAIAAYRDKAILAERKALLNQAAFIDTARVLFGDQQFHITGYGASVGYPPYNGYGQVASLALSSAGPQGQTVYGYSYNNLNAQMYGQTDMNALLQSYARTVGNAQQLAGQAHQDFGDITQQQATYAGRVAEVLARSQAARAVWDATAPSPQTNVNLTTGKFEFSSGTPPAMPKADQPPPAPKPNPPAVAPPPTPVPAQPGADAAFNAWKQSAINNCVACHYKAPDGGGKIEGGFDVSKFWYADEATKSRVKARLDETDDKKRMPLGKPALSQAEKELWFPKQVAKQ